jgi:hypothetical protein
MNTSETISPDAINIRTAYQDTAPERAALSAEQLVAVNVDVPQVITTALKALKNLVALRPDVSMLTKIDIAPYDKITVYAHALRFAQNRYVAASAQREILPETMDNAMRFREILLAESKSLLARGLIDRRPIDGLKGGNGYTGVAQDIGALVEVLRDHADDASAKVMALVQEAEVVAESINSAIVKRGDQQSTVDAVSDERQRAFTLLCHAYDEARRAVTFLRWHEGDADTLVPSFYGGRTRKSKSGGETETPAPVDATASTAPNEHVVPAKAPEPAPGSPGSSPFTNN